MRNIFNIVTLMLAAALVACGGGGESPGETHGPYSITLRAEKNQLPVNVTNAAPGIGAAAPYTTTLYVEALEGDMPIAGGKDIFSCNIVDGLGVGALVYLDGDDAHKNAETGAESQYRSITLGANSGAASFHFHAGNQTGTARVICTVTNPRDKRTYTSSTSIEVV